MASATLSESLKRKNVEMESRMPSLFLRDPHSEMPWLMKTMAMPYLR